MSFSTGFEVNAPPFSAHLGNMSLSAFEPEFKGHELSVDPAAKEESDITAVVDITPKMMVNLRLFDKLDLSAGLGAPIFLEANVQTGAFALDCDPGQTRLSIRAGASLKSFFGADENALGPFTKKEVYHQCK